MADRDEGCSDSDADSGLLKSGFFTLLGQSPGFYGNLQVLRPPPLVLWCQGVERSDKSFDKYNHVQECTSRIFACVQVIVAW